MLSQSETNLRMAGRGSVNIEIRQPGDSLSGEPGSRVHRPGRLGLPPSVSVVNLRTSSEHLYGTYGPVHQGGSVDALNRYPPSGQLVNQYPPSGQLVNLHHTNQIHSDHSKYFQENMELIFFHFLYDFFLIYRPKVGTVDLQIKSAHDEYLDQEIGIMNI